MSDRLATIIKLLAADPRDVFLNYSLGMEYASASRHEEAAGQFRKCIELDGAYLPAYVEAGKSLRAAGQLDAARAIFADGLKLAAAKGDGHIADHIKQQLEALK
jgi:tetratricopeptide (TPR) repeat protein